MLETRAHFWLPIVILGIAFLFLSPIGPVSCEPRMVGAAQNLHFTSLAEADEDATRALEFGIKYISEGSSSDYRLQLAKLLSAKSQVVSGIKYTFTVQVIATKCRKDMDIYDCTLPDLKAAFANATDFSDVRDQRFSESGELLTSTTEMPTTEEPDPRDNPDFNECEVKVWDRAWREPRYKVLRLRCENPNANEM